MDQIYKKLIGDNKAISESFTVFPSLAMILFGLTIFTILIATAYSSFNEKQDTIDMFEKSKEILDKLSSPNALFTSDGNKILLEIFNSDQSKDYIEKIQNPLLPYNLNFTVKLSGKDLEAWIPESPSFDKTITNQYASSKQVSVQVNEVTIIPGTLTVIFWEEKNN